MSNGITSTSSLEVEEYCKAVRGALADLPGELGADLLEDLPDHLTEVVAEGEGSLRERLGEPAEYAKELRAAAGLEPAALDGAATDGRARLADVAGRVAEAAGRLDLRIGRLMGYPRLVELLRAVRPGWWVLRGWLVAQFLCGVRDRGGWSGLIPSFGGNAVAGFCLTLAAIVASVWLGRRSLGFSAWPRRAMFVASAVIAVWAVTALASDVRSTGYTYLVGPASDGYPSTSDVSDIYVYDQFGNAVNGARLFDQNGNPIQLGSSVCSDGSIAPGAGSDGSGQAWSYPLCPSDPGPFRSGPGPVLTPTPSVSTAASSSAPATTDSAQPTAHPSKSAIRPTATASPTH